VKVIAYLLYLYVPTTYWYTGISDIVRSSYRNCRIWVRKRNGHQQFTRTAAQSRRNYIKVILYSCYTYTLFFMYLVQAILSSSPLCLGSVRPTRAFPVATAGPTPFSFNDDAAGPGVLIAVAVRNIVRIHK